MKSAYPIILTPADSGYVVYVPAMDINTEGKDLTDAVEMASDAIALCGITLQDTGKAIPQPDAALPSCEPGQLAAFALVDFDAYRRANDMRSVRKNVTLPNYLNELAEKAGLNFSQILQDGLKQQLRIS